MINRFCTLAKYVESCGADAILFAEFARRRKLWKPRKPYARRGALAKYARSVSSASLGAVTDRNLTP
jgi:dihydroxy-acid dehydratase